MRINSKGRLDYFNKSSLHIINNLELSIKSNMPKQILDKMLKTENRTDLANACFNFINYRAKLDLLGWNNIDIFSH